MIGFSLLFFNFAKNNSVNYGIMFIGFAAAGFLGPTIMRSTFNAVGNYNLSFLLAALIALLGIMILLIFKKLIHKKCV